jgi:hypothetical protein
MSLRSPEWVLSVAPRGRSSVRRVAEPIRSREGVSSGDGCPATEGGGCVQVPVPPPSTHPSAFAVPALSSQVRPAIVLPERETRALLQAAARLDVASGGCFSAGPAGIQLWSISASGGRTTRVHLGSVDWSYDTPVRHYATIYRSMVTAAGVDAGETTASVLARVLALTGVPLDSARIELPSPPRRDPFRTRGARL